jgi:hypothetical protein
MQDRIQKKKPLTKDQREEMAAYALKHYFSDKQRGKSWYQEGVTTETVFIELMKPGSPISLRDLESLWREKTSIRRSFFNREEELDPVEEYLLHRDNEPTGYSKSEATLNSIRGEFGITRAMVAKIASKGLAKVRYMLGGISPEDMTAEDAILLNERIDKARRKAAFWFSYTLWEHCGKVTRFFKLLMSKKILTKTEIDLITEDEFMTLTILAQLKPKEIEAFLLDDIEEDENLIKTFQNTVSSLAFAEMKSTVSTNEDASDEG